MGVPSFYRWLVQKYPKIVVDAVEEKGHNVDGSLSNPNKLEFDNLYLDMNAIIHPCFHPEDNLFLPTKFEEVFSNIYDYIERLFNIVRPRKLLYLAIDGVAPRTKMNQQRSRRFRAAKDRQIAEEIEDKFRKEFEMEGKVLLRKEESQICDSNVITPGTEFMYTLARKLESYIVQQISDNVAWRNIKVILSDANVPGEGEHKIMSYIRAQRSSPGYDPNTRHCLYGSDADLIMLALTTHEIHFSIIRENLQSPTEHGRHEDEACNLKLRGWFKKDIFPQTNCNESEETISQKEPANSVDRSLKKKPYQFLHVWILREYLALDLKITSPSEKISYDFERIIDDFILICCFAGNDFLPHIPSLEIHEGAVDLLMHVYKKEFNNLGGYLVDMQQVENKNGRYIKLKGVERLLISVGEEEDKIFEKRAQIRERRLRKILLEAANAKNEETNSYIAANETGESITFHKKDYDKKYQKEDESALSVNVFDDQILKNTKELKQKVKDYMRTESDLFKAGCFGTDKVKFGRAGWKERYYKEKFGVERPEEIGTTRKDVVTKYGEGLCWVLLYYFSGVPSWTWFYPYHYGPPASDFRGLTQTQVKFERGLPFKPFDQLMGVLPPKSAHALPEAYQKLMIDEESSIIDFYPAEFETDVDGKRFVWQGIVKLPFVDEKQLLIELMKLEIKLKDHEKKRNLESLDLLFASSSDKLGSKIISCSRALDRELNCAAVKIEIAEVGIDGTVHSVTLDEDSSADYLKNVICLLYECRQGIQHVPRVLEGVNIPEKLVDESDVFETKLWHEESGIISNFRFQNQYRCGKAESDEESCPKTSNVPNDTTKGAGSGFMGRGKTTMTALPVGRCTNIPEQAPRRAISQVTPIQHAPRVPASGWTNSWDPRTRGQYSSVPNYSTYNYSGSSNTRFGGNEQWQSLGMSSSIHRPQQRVSWECRPRGSWQCSSGQTWRNNQSSSTYNTTSDRGRGCQQPETLPRGSWQGSSGQTWRNNQSSSTYNTTSDHGRGCQQPETLPRGSRQGSSGQTWRNNQASSTYYTTYGRGRGCQQPETS